MADTVPNQVSDVSKGEIENLARDLRKKHGLERIPVNPLALANRLGFNVHNGQFAEENIVGMIAKRGDDVAILVNQDDPPFRKRFTIAHELGHYFLHFPKASDGDFIDTETNLFRMPREGEHKTDPQRRREIEANLFAISLLMPEDDVRREWPRLKSVEEMARLFNASEAAMGVRIDQLGLE